MADNALKNNGLRGPLSFAIFVVANISGQYRQLAIVRYEPSASDLQSTVLRGADAIRLCFGVVLAFAHPANRIAIEGELALAANMYAESICHPVAVFENAMKGWIWHNYNSRAWPQAPWLRELPFISLALRLATSYDPVALKHSGPNFNINMKADPLGVVYTSDNIKYAVGVVDISDLDAVRYGIIATGHNKIELPRNTNGDIYSIYDTHPEYEYVSETPNRTPLSAKEYMSKFAYKSERAVDEDAIVRLEAMPLISPEALNAVWPLTTVPTKDEDQQTEPREAAKQTKLEKIPARLRSLVHLAAKRLCDGLFHTTGSDAAPNEGLASAIGSKTTTLQSIAGTHFAQDALRRAVIEHAARLHILHPKMQVKLLVTAFSGERHLTWAAFVDLSVAVLHEALQHPDLHQAQSISLCIDTIQGTPKDIVVALSAAPASFQYLCLHQKPLRTNDNATTEFYRHLVASRLLRQRDIRVTLTGACSAALRNQMWIPTASTVGHAFDAFPVQDMFLRLQITNERKHKAFIPAYQYFGDTLMSAEAFAASFLTFLSQSAHEGVSPGPRVNWIFARGAMSVAELQLEPEKVGLGGFAVELPAAENLAIPSFPFLQYDKIHYGFTRKLTDIAVRRRPLADMDCCPLVRDPAPGSWTVLISNEKPGYNSRCPENGNGDFEDDDWQDDLVVRYAFVQAAKDDRGDIVGDLCTFLRETAPEVDTTLVEERLEEVNRIMVQNMRPSTVGEMTLPERRLLNIGKDEALELLAEFREDGRTYGRETLQIVMQEDKELTRDWYTDVASDLTRGVPELSPQLPAAPRQVNVHPTGKAWQLTKRILGRRSSTIFLSSADVVPESESGEQGPIVN